MSKIVLIFVVHIIIRYFTYLFLCEIQSNVYFTFTHHQIGLILSIQQPKLAEITALELEGSPSKKHAFSVLALGSAGVTHIFNYFTIHA